MTPLQVNSGTGTPLFKEDRGEPIAKKQKDRPKAISVSSNSD
jgi:hypothetical protein